MSELYDKYLTVAQQKKIKQLPDERRWNNYRNFDLEIETWDNFWNIVFKEKEDGSILKVLDFGCGAGYCEHVAATLGKNVKIVSLDIDTEEVKIVFGRFHKIMEIEAVHWNGNTLPYADKYFDAIISKASLSKLVNTTWDTIVAELSRVTNDNGCWYIAPHYMCNRLVQNLSSGIQKELMDKSVTMASWSWDLDDPRNRYWRNRGIVTPDGHGVHDDDYVNRDVVGARSAEVAASSAEELLGVIKNTEDE